MNNKFVCAIVATTMLLCSISFVGCNSNVSKGDNVIENESNEIDIEKENNKNKIESLNETLNDRYMILANKDNLLGAEFIPDDLVISEIAFQDYIETRELDRLVASKALDMFEAAKNDGVILLGASGYRSYSIQLNMYNTKVAQVGKEAAEAYLAPPGASEHQTGYALDILSADYPALDEGFENTDSFKWLIDNSYKFGFILRYPKDKVEITKYEYEPWHYRYVGEEVAKEIMDKKICFEEYIMSTKEEIERLSNKN